MKKEDFDVSVMNSVRGFFIADITHDEFDTEIFSLTVDDTKKLVDIINKFKKGEITEKELFNTIWSDGDLEEASTDVYISNDIDNGLVSEITDDEDVLIHFINEPNTKVYRLRIEDNLI